MWYIPLLLGWMIIGMVVFFFLFKFKAPFGKFSNSRWGARISNRLGWLIMELPALCIFPIMLLLSGQERQRFDLLLVIVIGMWVMHYSHRSLIYPMRIHARPRSMPLAVVFMALFYNTVNGWFLGYYYSYLYTPPAFYSPIFWVRIVLGGILFLAGFWINVYHDSLLINLRRNTKSNTYSIPTGGLFTYISVPNLFGEVIEWVGFAVIAQSLPALSVVLWTTANLVPRAYSVHHWYRERFPNYPPQRRAFLPLPKGS